MRTIGADGAHEEPMNHMAWRRVVRSMYREKMKTGGRGMKKFEKIEIKSGDYPGNNFVSKKPEIKSGKRGENGS